MIKAIQVMKKTHYYLVDTSVVTTGAAVSELQFNIIHEEPFTACDLMVVIHISTNPLNHVSSCIRMDLPVRRNYLEC